MKAGKHQRKKRQESLQLTSAKCTQQHSQHFNSTGHSISDVQVRGVTLCSGTNIQRKQREMRLIFQLGTVQPKGLNINFIFIRIGTLYTSCARYYVRARLDHFYDVYYIAWYCTTVFSHTEEGS